MGGCNAREVIEGKFKFFHTKLSNWSEFFYLELGLYHSNTEIVEAMNMLVQKRNNHTEIFVAVKVSLRTQKVEIHPGKDKSGLAFLISDLGCIAMLAMSFGREST